MTAAVFEVLQGGLLTTVQDLGRPGHLASGLAEGGAADRLLLHAANLLVGNPPGAAALEFTLDGPVVAVRGDVAVAVVAYGGHWYVGGLQHPLPLWETVLVADGSVLVVGAVTAGVRGYLAVAGGIDVPAMLGSRSTHVRARLGGLGGRALATGDVLRVGTPPALETVIGRQIPRAVRPHHRSAPVRVMLGPQEHAFALQGLRTFLSQPYRVLSRSDRMAVRLRGMPIAAREGYDVLSDPTAAGSVQVTGDGQPVILLGERQTTGGYPKIATVITADLDTVGQLRPGEQVRFAAVGEGEAREALRQRQRRLAAMMRAVGPIRPGATVGVGSRRNPAGFMVSTGGGVYRVVEGRRCGVLPGRRDAVHVT